MIRIFGSPHRYVQGPGALATLPQWTERLAGHAPVVLVTDPIAWELVRTAIEAAYQSASQTIHAVLFEGEITFATIERSAAEAQQHSPGVVIGLGGGKGLDVGKGVAHALKLPVITAPTIASNDSPTSRSFAVHNDEHVMVSVERMPRSPEVVLVDTAVIAGAPVNFLLSGIGDAIAKKFEGEAADAGGRTANSHKTRPLRTGLVIGDGCYRIIREYAEAAVKVAGSGKPNDAFEYTVEACALLSGLGFENTGLSIAHSMTRGLMATPSTARNLHGLQVAYGLLVQLHTEGRDKAFIDDMLDFYGRIGLPRTLRDLGMKTFVDADVQRIVELSMKAPHLRNVPRPVHANMMKAAIRNLEQAAR